VLYELESETSTLPGGVLLRTIRRKEVNADEKLKQTMALLEVTKGGILMIYHRVCNDYGDDGLQQIWPSSR
jgi:predicted NUDIX family phosphoesterase